MRWIVGAMMSLLVLGVACAREPVLGGPCEGCEAVFDGLPTELASSARIGAPDQAGEPMTIKGRVFGPDGRAPAAGVIVYAYSTDNTGVYPALDGLGSAARRHGRLRAWVRSDADGNYEFHGIRPAAYPGRNVPAHVHMHVIEPGRGTYYIDDIVFTDDPLLTAAERARMDRGRGGSGVATPLRDAQGVWQVRRDIRLGQGIAR